MGYEAIRAAALSSAASLLVGCASTPEPAESARVCPELSAAHASDKREFYARSPLHRQYAEQFGAEAFKIGIAEQQAGLPRPQGTYGERIAYGAVKACTPVHGETKCRSVLAEYAAYEDRAYKRNWEQIRYKCMSRGYD